MSWSSGQATDSDHSRVMAGSNPHECFIVDYQMMLLELVAVTEGPVQVALLAAIETCQRRVVINATPTPIAPVVKPEPSPVPIERTSPILQVKPEPLVVRDPVKPEPGPVVKPEPLPVQQRGSIKRKRDQDQPPVVAPLFQGGVIDLTGDDDDDDDDGVIDLT